MKGILFAVIGGAFIILQGTFNAKLSSDIGIWSTSIITHLIGFLVATSVFFIKKAGTVKDLKGVKKVYLTSGVFGAVIIYAETFSIYAMGITLTAGTLMVAQLLTATIIEIYGLLNIKKTLLKSHHIVGTIIMILGILVFNR
ncbi:MULTISPECIES: DMT family transporter [unclassified Lysinibacillus]|uniref:DMT family transporter n=1 Tax=unclassified Lysinibacillus TaxID=2636778 RepID=UPI0038044BDB